jgi:hypothetical protein
MSNGRRASDNHMPLKRADYESQQLMARLGVSPDQLIGRAYIDLFA